MAWIVFVEGQAIGPFAKEADADKRAEQELRARERGVEAIVSFLVYPDWVEAGKTWSVPFEIVLLRDGVPVVHRPFGDDALGPLNLDDL